MLSVAICTRNRARVLEETLEALGRLDVTTDWELLVCANACTDDTADVARRYADRLPLRLVEESTLGLSAARNRALVEARGAVLAFVDDDVTPDTGWLTALNDGAAAAPTAGIFGGPIRPVFPPDADPFVLSVLPSIRRGFAGLDYGTEPRDLTWPEYPFGANMAFRTAAIGSIRFDPALGYRGTSLVPGEERDFVKQVAAGGWSTRWIPGMALEHRIPADRLTPAYLMRLTHDYSELAAREQPCPPGRLVAGVPGWLWQRYVAAVARSALARYRGSRADSIVKGVEAARLRGQIRGIRKGPVHP